MPGTAWEGFCVSTERTSTGWFGPAPNNGHVQGQRRRGSGSLHVRGRTVDASDVGNRQSPGRQLPTQPLKGRSLSPFDNVNPLFPTDDVFHNDDPTSSSPPSLTLVCPLVLQSLWRHPPEPARRDLAHGLVPLVEPRPKGNVSFRPVLLSRLRRLERGQVSREVE